MAGKYRNLVRAVFDSPWAILPEKLTAMVDLLELRAAGDSLSEEDVSARIGQPRVADQQQGGSSIGVISVFGVMAQRMGMMERISGGVSTEAVAQQFDAMLADTNVRAIVLQIESPGGSVFGLQELADKVYAARGKKPVIAVADSYAASAAYWLASQADELVVAPGGQLGSIGVYRLHTDTSAAEEKAGVKYTVVKAAPYKAETEYGPLSEEAKAHWQDGVDAYYEQFVSAVARGRNVSEATVKRSFGQGRMILAEDAVKAGMADRIGTFASVLSNLNAGKVSAVASAQKPAFSLKGIIMNPKVFGALVRLGMCKIDATEAEAQAALSRFCAVNTVAESATEDAKLTAIEAYIAKQGQSIVAVATQLATVEASDDRAADILAAVRLSNVADPMALAQRLIADKSLSLSAALRKIEEAAVSNNRPAGATIEAGEAEVDKFQSLARDNILSAAWGNSTPSQVFDRNADAMVSWQSPQRNYGFQSLMGLARETLHASGVRSHRLSNADIARIVMGKPLRDFGIQASSDGQAYNVSGMYSNILYDAANVMLRRSYLEANTTFQAWMKQGESLTDFKPVHKVIAGELPDPKAIPEDGEFEDSSMTDGRESYSLTVWGRIFSLSWQAIVNDRLSAFTEIPMKQGRAMRRKQNKLAYGVLKDNATLSDGGALFNATAITTAGGHNNLSTGSASPSVSTLNTMNTKMAKQKGLDANTSSALNLTPHWILSGPALRGTVLELMGSTSYVQSNSNSGVKNIWQNALEPVFDEEMGASTTSGSDTAWYLACNSGDVDTIEYAYMQGLDTPALDQEQAFTALAIKFRIYQAFATKALDYRGLQKHNGV